jgi:hypothetical protein
MGRLAGFPTLAGLAMGGGSWWYANRLATMLWPQRQSSLQDNREQPPQDEPTGIQQTQAVSAPSPVHESNSTPAPGRTKFREALALVALTDEPSETSEKELITLLDEALRLGLNSLETIQARIMRGFAKFSLATFGPDKDSHSLMGSQLLREAVAEIEAAVVDDRVTKAGNFDTWAGRHLGEWRRLDAYYAYHAGKIHHDDGPPAAIKFLEEKLSLFSHSPVPMLPVCWNELGTLYATTNARMRAKEAFEAAIRAEGYVDEIADDIKAMARRNLSRLAK